MSFLLRKDFRLSGGFSFFGVFLLNACSSNFSVVSTPSQVDVFYENTKTGERKSLGQTPLEIPMSQISDLLQSEEEKLGAYFPIIFEKNGFVTQRLAVPKAEFGTFVTSLDVKLKEGDGDAETKRADKILDAFFLAQKLTLNNEFQRAQVEIDKILALAPDFAKAYSMRASIYFMQKNYPESLKWYEAAVKSDPKMDSAVQMIATINRLMGGRNVAGAPR
jgi:tetratricopeptide (TPR) repeat protein